MDSQTLLTSSPCGLCAQAVVAADFLALSRCASSSKTLDGLLPSAVLDRCVHSDALVERSEFGETSLLESLRAYVLWTREVWSRTLPQSRAAELGGLDDLLVIACGLPGEAGEMLEQNAFVGTSKENWRELVLEFGDVLYFWARIVHHFDIDMADVLAVSNSHSFIPPGAARLPISVGQVCESIKKYVRNDQLIFTPIRRNQLIGALGCAWQDYSFILALRELSLAQVTQANKVKMSQRKLKQLARQARQDCAHGVDEELHATADSPDSPDSPEGLAQGADGAADRATRKVLCRQQEAGLFGLGQAL